MFYYYYLIIIGNYYDFICRLFLKLILKTSWTKDIKLSVYIDIYVSTIIVYMDT